MAGSQSGLLSSSYAQWASLFSRKLFVQLVSYADESGIRRDDGSVRGSEVMVVAGFVATVESCADLHQEWCRILKKYGAPYFHAREWASASAVLRQAKRPQSDHSKNPYRDWPLEKLDAFYIELANVLNGGKRVKVAGCFDVKSYSEFLRKIPDNTIKSFPEGCVHSFFESLVETVNLAWPTPETSVTVFFDRCDEKKWRHAIADAHYRWRKGFPKLGEIVFGDKTKDMGIPLQGADMVAYRLRQLAALYYGHDKKNRSATTSRFDRILFGEKYDAIEKLFPTPLRQTGAHF